MSNQSIISGLPHDKEAEQAILGAILIRNEVLLEALATLKPNFFFQPAHQSIFRAMIELYEAKQPIDDILVGDQLKSNHELENCGGYAYLNELKEYALTPENINYYVKIVHDHFLLRDLIHTTTDIAKKSRDPNYQITDLLAEAESKIQEIGSNTTQKSYSHIRDVLQTNIDHLEEVSQNEDEITGIPSGFIDLDKITSGLQNSDLIIIAGRPSMGKTALSLNISHYVATKVNRPSAVLIFSLEMSKEQLSLRLLSSEAKIDSSTLRSGNLAREHWDNLAIAVEQLSQAPIYINDTPQLTVYEMSMIAKQLDQEIEGGLSLIVIDYLQLAKAGNTKTQNREQEIAEISRNLKGLAKELNIPIIVGSQLNRALENRSDKRPVMSDLRESGSIEQDSDIIMFIYRDEVYNEDSKDKGTAEIIIGKHRNGALGMVRLAFIGKYTKFANFSSRALE